MFLSKLFRSRCRACERLAPLRPLGEVESTHPGPFHTARFGLVHCPRCEVIYLNPAPTPQDLRVLYEDSVQFSDDHYTSPEQVAKILDYYSHCVRSHDLLAGGNVRVLEVGAGYGWVSRACKDIDPSSETTAQDVTAECAESCPWIDTYFVGPLEDLPDSEPFGLVSMTHVIEHLVDPATMLRSIGNRLRKNGKLFVTAPYRPSGWKAGDGIEPWRQYSYMHVPAHVTYLSRDWFELVSARIGMRIAHWDAGHEDGQAFELVLEKH